MAKRGKGELNARKNDVIQINERYQNRAWIGCTMLVEKSVHDYVRAYMRIPYQGEMTLIVPHDQYDVIGIAAMIANHSRTDDET